MQQVVTDPVVWSIFIAKTTAGACGIVGISALFDKTMRPSTRLTLCLALLLGIGLYGSLLFVTAPRLLVTKSGSHPWVGAVWLRAILFVSGLTAGVAALVVGNHHARRHEIDPRLDRLERVLGGLIIVELGILIGLALSMRGNAGIAFQRWPGLLIPLFVVPVGLVLPLVHRKPGGERGLFDAALFVLLGEFVLSLAIVGIPRSIGLQ